MTDYLKLAQDIVNRASTDGIQVEAFINEDKSTQIRIDRGEVEQLSQSGSKGLGVRVIDGGKVGYAFTSDFSDESIQKTIDTAIELCQVATPDDNRTLPALQDIPDEDLEIFDPDFENITTEQKIEVVKRAEKATYDADSRIIHAQSNYSDSLSATYLANSNGFAGSYKRTAVFAYTMVTARDEELNDQAMGTGLSSSNFFNEIDPEAVGKEGAYKATLTLGGKPVPTQKASVVFDHFAMGQIIAMLAFAMKGDALQRGQSFLIGKQGQEIGSDKVTLMDNGRMKRGMGSAPFDGEGVPTSATRLVDEGIFQKAIYDTYFARQEGDGAISTGNAQRGSHRDLPSLSISNFYLQPGPTSREEIIGGVENGLLVTRIMQTGGINPITGDCSMAASGRWIKDGELTDPINGVTVATTLPDLLRNVSEVGNDLRFLPFMGALGTPTVRVDNVTIGGASGE